MTATTRRRAELVDWRALAPADRDAVRGLEISAEQIEFAGDVGKSVAACEAADPAEVAGLAVRVDGAIAGWVVLKRGAAVVSGLRIDVRHQGRGIGGAALAEMAGWVARHWPQATRLMLRVDDGNVAGIRAYEKAGWTEAGERRVGRVGIERTMSLRL